MRTFLVAYALTRPELNQPYLAEAIMNLGAAWARPLDNLWYVRMDGTEKSIEGRLGRLLDTTDGLVVQEARGDAAMANTGLHWFRPRRSGSAGTAPAEEHTVSATLVAFPGSARSSPRDAGTGGVADAAAAAA